MPFLVRIHVILYGSADWTNNSQEPSLLQPIDRNLPPLTEEKLVFEFSVKVDISEDDGKGGFSPALYEKDCFKLRLNLNKTITLTVTQGSTRPIIVERCMGPDINLMCQFVKRTVCPCTRSTKSTVVICTCSFVCTAYTLG